MGFAKTGTYYFAESVPDGYRASARSTTARLRSFQAAMALLDFRGRFVALGSVMYKKMVWTWYSADRFSRGEFPASPRLATTWRDRTVLLKMISLKDSRSSLE